ncbi:hypothetical protein F2Q69_00025012 [Brassica cretica]|uniref:Uncharacterized protein n=1 Tax=Brassica cretica TaxID=69181 RepID=A0A8S9QER7_BRACR|nr:hypothetical protein F2Q69_00025012 [Brassica cretica]
MPILLRSGQSASREEAVEKRNVCRSIDAELLTLMDMDARTWAKHILRPFEATPSYQNTMDDHKPYLFKNNTDRVLQIQEAPGPSAPPPRKDFLVVDLNAAGLSSPRISACGSDSNYDSGSDSISADDDNPPTESDRFIEC